MAFSAREQMPAKTQILPTGLLILPVSATFMKGKTSQLFYFCKDLLESSTQPIRIYYNQVPN